MGCKDLRFGQIVCILVFYNISFSWLLPLDGFQFIIFFVPCLLRDSENEELNFVPLSFSLHENAFDTEACALTGVHHRDVIVFKNVCFHPSTRVQQNGVFENLFSGERFRKDTF